MKHRAAIVTAWLAAASSPAAAQSFSQFLGFGDSTIDSGSYRSLASPGGGARFDALWPSAVAAGAGKPTTSPGQMSSEALAGPFGLTATPADQGGTNYATSRAKNVETNPAPSGGFTAAVPIVTQIGDYLAANRGQANPNALYLISSGGNDVLFALGYSGPGSPPADPTAYIVSAANSLTAAIANLKAAGARYFVVPNLTYSFPTDGSSDNAAARQDKLDYTQTLWSGLAAAGVNFIPADINAMRLAIAANPSSFGFQFIDTTNVACTRPAGVTSSWALLCSSNPAAPSHLVTPNADQTYLFADNQHFTTAGQTIEADYEYSLVVAPSEISYLAEVPVQTRANVVNTILTQIPISERERATKGFNAWITGDLSSLNMTNATGFPDASGTPATVTAGIDYKATKEWIFGAALSIGVTTQSFDLGGSFTQNEFAVSLYAGYFHDPIWFNVIASYGGLRYDVNRVVPIGITLQSNTGSTSGTNASLAGEVGYNFTTGPITHGPVAGITLQQVHVNGFTETDAFASVGGFTALSFADQTRNSAVSELGYQASFDWGIWHPFFKAVWNHELASTDRQVTASLTSMVARSFSMPAVVFGTDWATGTVGATAMIGPGIRVYAAVTGQTGQSNVMAYGGQIGLNVAFNPPSDPTSARN